MPSFLSRRQTSGHQHDHGVALAVGRHRPPPPATAADLDLRLVHGSFLPGAAEQGRCPPDLPCVSLGVPRVTRTDGIDVSDRWSYLPRTAPERRPVESAGEGRHDLALGGPYVPGSRFAARVEARGIPERRPRARHCVLAWSPHPAARSRAGVWWRSRGPRCGPSTGPDLSTSRPEYIPTRARGGPHGRRVHR